MEENAMAGVSLDLIKKLRERTQASFADCRAVLEETGGDLEEAVKLLRVRGAAIAEKRAAREAKAGIIEAYVHGNAQIGVLVDLRAETDFVARSPQFRALAHDLALHIAAANPRYLKPEDIPEDVRTEERRLIEQQFAASGKPPQVLEKIIEGKLAALAKEICLLEQPFVKDPDRTVRNILEEAVAKFGEKIEVARFTRYQI
jgi:elongation factor Ts